MKSQLAAYSQLIGGAVLLSTGSAAIKATSFTALELAGWRAIVVAVFLLLVIRPARVCWTLSLAPAAIAHGLTAVLFLTANKLTNAATAIFLHYTSPLYLLLLGPLVLKEPVAARDYGYVAVLLVGMVLLLTHPGGSSRTASDPQLGAIIAACGGFTWALTTLTMRALARQPVDGFQRSIAAAIVANAVLALVLIPWVGIPLHAQALDWGITVYMGVFQLGSSFILVSLGLRRVTALESALILLLEPVLNPLWVWYFHREHPGAISLLGGGIILATTTWRTLARTRALRAS